MNIRRQGSLRGVKIPGGDRTAPDASRRLARIINQVELPKRVVQPDTVPDYGKRTHKGTEPKVNPRSYRLSVSADLELKAILKTLGIVNNTTGVEACIHAVAQRLNISH